MQICKYTNAVIKFFYFIINEILAIENVFHYSILKFPNSLNIFREFFSTPKSNPYQFAGDSLMSLKATSKLIVLSIISLVIKAVIEIVSLKVNPN